MVHSINLYELMELSLGHNYLYIQQKARGVTLINTRKYILHLINLALSGKRIAFVVELFS